VEQIRLPLPPWLDWPWALRTLTNEVRVPGERVDLLAGQLDWVHEGADRPIVISVTTADGHLQIRSDGNLRETTEAVRSRFHLDLTPEDVTEALGMAGIPVLEGGASWTRKPAAASGWAYSITYLAGGDPDDPSITRLFDELGEHREGSPRLVAAPGPDDLLRAGSVGLADLGIKRSRAENLIRLASLVHDRPRHLDSAGLRSMDPNDALILISGLPHIARGEHRG
jgi:hypothetical protein